MLPVKQLDPLGGNGHAVGFFLQGALRSALGDVREAGRVSEITLEVAPEPSVEVILAPEDPAPPA